jgi:cell fate regulator YaaT (PSP1 superfamily)
MKPQIVGVRFQEVGKIYHFDASSVDEVRVGDRVIVDTARGQQLGEIANLVDDPNSSNMKSLKSVERKATPRDLILKKDWQNKEAEALINCRERASQLNIQGVKFIAAEFNFDGSRLNIMYNSDSEDKVNLKSLRTDIGKYYPNTRVDLRQIGPRDVAKIIGGMGACGLEKRCCSNFITEFSPISIKMAKEQGISLTPAEITGMCGRLRCCLIYEYQNYVTAKKELPKRGKKVTTPRGDGKVIHVNPLSMSVTVDIPNEGKSDFLRDELEPWNELEALRRKSAEPCQSEGEGCNCGKSK